jgi:hypothetical protein
MSSLESRQCLSKAVSPFIPRKSGWRSGKMPWPAWYQPPIMPKGVIKRTNATDLIAAACLHAGISVHEFKSERRIAEYARPRHAVAYVLKRYRPDLSNVQVARHLGRKDHSTIIHAVKAAEKLRRECPDFASLVLHLEGIANGA